GEAGLEAAVARAYVSDPAALQSFRDRTRRDGGILPMLEIHLGGFDGKLTGARSGLKSDFEKIPTGPMTIMSAGYGCLGAELAIGGGAGLMVAGMLTEDGAMFGFGAVALGIGIGAAAAFC